MSGQNYELRLIDGRWVVVPVAPLVSFSPQKQVFTYER